VLFGGSVFTIFAGIYYWFPKMTGRMYDERLGKLALLADVHRLQPDVLPDALHRPAGDAAPRRRLRAPFADLNLFISIASFGLGASTLVFLYNMITRGAAARAPANPWRALTLEWQVSSPPPIFNFDEIPHGRRRARTSTASRAPGGAHRRRPRARGPPFRVTLVIANKTSSGKELIEHSRAKASDGQHLFIAVVPQADGSGGPPARRAPAREDARPAQPAGLLSSGMIGDPDPYTATINALELFRVDDVVISTLPDERSGWLRSNLIERVAQRHLRAMSSTSSSTRRPPTAAPAA
jgi:hypothetical protein